MANKAFRDLVKDFDEQDHRVVKKGKQLLLMEYELVSHLRKDQDLSQKELADILEIRQSAISKLENQDDIMVRTLEKYIKALGGELEIRAKFPDRVVTLKQFTDGAEAVKTG